MSEYTIDSCRSCNAQIVWAVTIGGKRMPVDAMPSADGTVALLERAGMAPLATVLSVTKRFGRKDLRTSHFAHCRDAGSWRNRVVS